MSSTVQLSLGSNLADREQNLRACVMALRKLEGVRVGAISHCYETVPISTIEQPDFLNMAVSVETELDPVSLLNATQGVERALGRLPQSHGQPRTIDIDIVLWGATRLESPRLKLPHAEFRNRAFVLAPLAEIAPDAVDPVTGLTVAQLAESPQAQGAVIKLHKLDL